MTTGYSTSSSTSSKTRRPRRSWREPCWHSLPTETWLSTKGRGTKLNAFPLPQKPGLSVRLRQSTSYKEPAEGGRRLGLCRMRSFHHEVQMGSDNLPRRPPWAVSLKDAKPLPLKLCLLSSIHIHEWKKLISPLSSILSKIIKFMCVRGLNRSLRRSVSLLLSAPTSDSLGSV